MKTLKRMDIEPDELRIRMRRANVKQVQIASKCAVSRAMVHRVIENLVVSDNVRRTIAEAINEDVARLWPSTYVFKVRAGDPGSTPQRVG